MTVPPFYIVLLHTFGTSDHHFQKVFLKEHFKHPKCKNRNGQVSLNRIDSAVCPHPYQNQTISPVIFGSLGTSVIDTRIWGYERAHTRIPKSGPLTREILENLIFFSIPIRGICLLLHSQPERVPYQPFGHQNFKNMRCFSFNFFLISHSIRWVDYP